MTEALANEYVTTLNGGISNSATSITVTAAPPAALSGGNFRMRLGDTADGSTHEYILVSSVSGSTLTVTRGVEGSTAVAWSSGDRIAHVLTTAGLASALTNVTLLGTTSVGGSLHNPGADNKAVGKKFTTPGAGIVFAPEANFRAVTSTADVAVWGVFYTDDGGSPSRPLNPVGGWYGQAQRMQWPANTDMGWITIQVAPIYVPAATTLWALVGRSYQSSYIQMYYAGSGSDVEATFSVFPQMTVYGGPSGPTFASAGNDYSIRIPFLAT